MNPKLISGLVVAFAVAGCATKPATLGDHTGFYHRVAFSPDGRSLAASRAWEESVIFDAASRRETARFKPDKKLKAGSLVALSYTPDGRLLAAHLKQNAVTVWDVRASNLISRVALPGSPYWSALSPDGRWLATAAKEGAPAIWEVATARKLIELTNGPTSLTALVFSPDNRWLAAAGKQRGVCLWDVGTGAFIRELPSQEETVRFLAIAPNHERIAASGNEVSVFCLTNVESRQTIPSPSLSTGAKTAGVLWMLLSTLGGRPSGSSEVFSRAPSGSVEFSPDGTHLAVINSAANTDTALGQGGEQVRVFELSRTQLVATVAYNTHVCSAAFSPDGNWIATAGLGVDVWDWANAGDKPARPNGYAPVVIQLQTNSPATSPARLPAASVRVAPFVDARPQEALGERTAAFKVKMSDVLPARPVVESLRDAVVALFGSAVQPTAAGPAKWEIAGTVKTFSVRTPASLVGWKIEAEAELELRVTNDQGPVIHSAIYQGQGRRKTATWPTKTLIEQACNDALRQLLEHIQLDPVWEQL